MAVAAGCQPSRGGERAHARAVAQLAAAQTAKRYVVGIGGQRPDVRRDFGLYRAPATRHGEGQGSCARTASRAAVAVHGSPTEHRLTAGGRRAGWQCSRSANANRPAGMQPDRQQAMRNGATMARINEDGELCHFSGSPADHVGIPTGAHAKDPSAAQCHPVLEYRRHGSRRSHAGAAWALLPLRWAAGVCAIRWSTCPQATSLAGPGHARPDHPLPEGPLITWTGPARWLRDQLPWSARHMMPRTCDGRCQCRAVARRSRASALPERTIRTQRCLHGRGDRAADGAWRRLSDRMPGEPSVYLGRHTAHGRDPCFVARGPAGCVRGPAGGARFDRWKVIADGAAVVELATGARPSGQPSGGAQPLTANPRRPCRASGRAVSPPAFIPDDECPAFNVEATKRWFSQWSC